MHISYPWYALPLILAISLVLRTPRATKRLAPIVLHATER